MTRIATTGVLRRRRCNALGMTLIEILIALFVFLLGVMGVLSIFPVAMKTASDSMGQARGTILARSLLAQIQADCQAVFYEGAINSTTPTTVYDDSGPGWTAHEWEGYFVTIINTSAPDPANFGRYQTRIITANTTDTLTVNPEWEILPQTGDSFVITRLGLPSAPVLTVDADVGGTTSTSFPVAYMNTNPWPTDWADYGVMVIYSNGPTDIKGNTSTIETIDPGTGIVTITPGFDAAPAEGDLIAIVNPITREALVRELRDANVPGGDGDIDIRAGAHPTSGTSVPALTWDQDLASTVTWAPGVGQVGPVQNCYYAAITSGRGSGSVFPVTAHISDATNGDALDVDFPTGSSWTDLGVSSAWIDADASDLPIDLNETDTGRATSFTVIGNPTFLRTVSAYWDDAADGKPAADERFAYYFNAFGTAATAAPWQVGRELFIRRGPDADGDDVFDAEEQDARVVSEYSTVAIFSDSGELPGGPVRVDVFVYRNFDNSQPPQNNKPAVAHITRTLGSP
jgi:Tfp pilus assembly protein PilV